MQIDTAMTPNYELLPSLIQWLHVGSVVLMIGGFFFLRVILLPATKPLRQPEKSQVTESAFRRFRPVIWIGLITILASGIYNYVDFLNSAREQTRTAFETSPDYSVYILILGVKLFIVFLIFTLGIVLTFPYTVFSPFQKRPTTWLNITICLGIVVLFLSAFLRRMY